MKVNSLYTKALILGLLVTSGSSVVFSAPQKAPKTEAPQTRIELKGFGELFLKKTQTEDSNGTQLILSRDKNFSTVCDNYEGLEPYQLFKQDLDGDNKAEIVVTLRYPESPNVIPYVYVIGEGLERIFPKTNSESELLNCREVFTTTYQKAPALGLKYLISFHDYAPPELYRLEMYTLKNNELKLVNLGYNEGNHFNLLMNLGAEYMHKGNTLEAANFYSKALASSIGEMSEKAFVECLFSNAEALKFSGKYEDAIKIYEKIVLEHTDSEFTETAQRELEFLFANKKNPKLLNEYFKVQSEIVNDNTKVALEMLVKMINNNPSAEIMDRLLFTKAELLVAEDRIDEAMNTYKDIKVKFPDSVLIDSVDEMLEDLEAKPEDTDGL